jgi:hypothetical protein
MGVTITSKKQKEQKAVKPDTTTLLVDEYADCVARVAAVAKYSKRAEEIKRALRDEAEDKAAPDEVVSFEGTTGVLEFSEKPVERQILDLAAVKKAMGPKVFMEVAKVTLGDVDKYLTPEEVAALVASDRTGTRKAAWKPKEQD